MDTLACFLDGWDPVGPDDSCALVARRFGAEPTALSLAVVRGEQPLGLISRDVFHAVLAHSPVGLAGVTASAVMDPTPMIVEGSTSVSDFSDEFLSGRPEVMGRGAIVVRDGKYLGVAGSALLAARRTRKAQARESSALIEELSVGIGRHLHNLIGFAERLGRQSLPADARAWVRAIADTSGDLHDLTVQARELHRAQFERLELTLAPCRLRDLADLIDGHWSGRGQGDGPKVMVSYDGDPGAAAVIDAERIVRCFDALIHRAYAASRAHGGRAGIIEATLRAVETPEGVRIEGQVRDGAAGGFDQDALLTAQSPETDLPVRLRMALATRTLALMGARFEVEETVSGGGLIAFRVTAEAADIDRPAERSRLASEDRPIHVLVVDDNATNRMVAESLCVLLGCTTESAFDGLAALEAVKARPFDVILMDIRMPRMDGIEATRAIRRLQTPARRIPILALTANADPADVETYIAAGMQGAVEKPVKPDKLAEALDAVLPASERRKTAAA